LNNNSLIARALLLATLVSGVVSAPQATADEWASVVWQNDWFSGRDGGGYTNGLFVARFQVANSASIDAPMLTQPLSWLLNDNFELAFNEHSIGQMMITPTDISQPVPNPNDVPYAGLLIYRAGHVVINDNIADMVRTTIGVLGPASLAENSQKFIHKVVGATEPKGWDYQLKNEPVAAVYRARAWRYPLSHMSDVVLLGQAQGGNLESGIGAGAVIRFGRGLKRSFATTLLTQGRTTTPAAVENGWYGYVGLETEYVFNNILINGNTYRDSPSSDLRHQQLSWSAGASYAWDTVSVTLGYKSGTALDTLDSSRDSFGTITLAWKL
jgi:hypothetical protein